MLKLLTLLLLVPSIRGQEDSELCKSCCAPPPPTPDKDIVACDALEEHLTTLGRAISDLNCEYSEGSWNKSKVENCQAITLRVIPLCMVEELTNNEKHECIRNKTADVINPNLASENVTHCGCEALSNLRTTLTSVLRIMCTGGKRQGKMFGFFQPPRPWIGQIQPWRRTTTSTRTWTPKFSFTRGFTPRPPGIRIWPPTSTIIPWTLRTRPPITPITFRPPITPITFRSPITPITQRPPITPITLRPPITPITLWPPTTPITLRPPITSITLRPRLPLTNRPPIFRNEPSFRRTRPWK